MSLHLPARRLLRPAGSPLLTTSFLAAPSTLPLRHSPSNHLHQPQCPQRQQHRGIKWWPSQKPSKKPTSSDPFSQMDADPALRRKAQGKSPTVSSTDVEAAQEKFQSQVTGGGIFDTEIAEADSERKRRKERGGSGVPMGASSSQAMMQQQAEGGGQSSDMGSETIDPENSKLYLDPDPRARVRWERKKVIQMVRKGGRTTREERIRISERKIMMRSPYFFTSVKKLGALTRQIAGKTVDDALVQMRFSKKKFAKHISRHLELSKNMAVAKKGMGLGKATGEAPLAKPVEIETKKKPGMSGMQPMKKKLVITDPTRIYIDEAWVNKGSYYTSRIYRHGRGMKSLWKTPSTSMTVVLKEEKTRMRQHRERQIKQIKAKPWVHLPDKPVTAQRPYYSW
ncbi:uncharacterized protein MKZ38_010258 [Zalerion maritima]|uniref:Ribosomal protein L22 n=1 Tax=Zalerion maritima TaxID=339359 RepID=A0AAD5S0V2_9PEZI|nr:uncharacterized protein MKZ38_010258 [Zalerion maritima]